MWRTAGADMAQRKKAKLLKTTILLFAEDVTTCKRRAAEKVKETGTGSWQVEARIALRLGLQRRKAVMA